MSLSLGQAIWIAVKPIIKIYLIMGTGYLLGRYNIFSVDGTRAVSDLVLMVLMPLLSFNKIVSNIDIGDIKNVGIICLSSMLLFGAGLLSALVVRKILPVPREWRNGMLAGNMFPNIGDLPIAYLQTLAKSSVFTPDEGNKGVANSIIYLTVMMVCVFNLGGFRLIESDFKYRDEENDLHETKNEVTSHSKSTSTASPRQLVEEDIEDEEMVADLGASVADLPSLPAEPSPSTVISSNGHSPDKMVPIPLTNANRSRRDSHATYSSSHHRSNSLVSTVRSIDLRRTRAGMNELVREYSHVDRFGRRRTLSEDSVASDSTGIPFAPIALANQTSTLTRILTTDATISSKDIKESGRKLPKRLSKFPFANHIVFFFMNCLRPCSMAVIVSLIIAFVPWLKALFVRTPTTVDMHQAPDNQPVLSFVIDFAEYVGAASVPFAILILGATLSRLKLSGLYPGFWKTAVTLVFLKLIVMPIIGVLWCWALTKTGWVSWEDDRMVLFVTVINWSLPTMTATIYFTASYTPIDATETIQLDCIAFFLLLQYPLLMFTLPTLVTYVLKSNMHL
ncbi:HFL307Cp [Eremothecium sinecaudum]|uniref:HFL307Cp n=1 Tax=Eremothecium sinecaudum TaxID=45286 RepID=A0A0X8HU96_9SACH|nr:HFL307Cp [Eremothecium sinecaudum]AMD21549.1 HFL307Cp [Eremothecium sinecaudum]